MRKTLRHLPEQNRAELMRIADKISERLEPEKIILFGSYARGDFKDGPHKQGKGRLTIHKKSDYDILLITNRKTREENAAIRRKAQQMCNRHKLSTHVRIIVHDIRFVNSRLAERQFFFRDIYKQGVLLYDSQCFGLLRYPRQPIPVEKKIIAEDHFEEWFNTAKDFYLVYEQCIKIKKYKLAAFNLHQSAEASYKAVLLVFTNYSPHEHYLEILGASAARHGRALLDVFPTETTAQRKLFELLDYAYIGARYDREYKITKAQLEQLAPCVQKLHQLTERVCTKKINSFFKP